MQEKENVKFIDELPETHLKIHLSIVENKTRKFFNWAWEKIMNIVNESQD